MGRKISSVAPEWWDYTTLDDELIRDVAKLTAKDLLQLSRSGFRVVFYETLQEFYLAEAMEYIHAWRQAKASEHCGICGPIGPTEQLPLVAELVNSLHVDLSHAHFWAMDEWVENGKAVPVTHPLSFEKADRELCFNRINSGLKMPEAHLHFPRGDFLEYKNAWEDVRCVLMQGGQGEIKHWAFNDPPKREGVYKDRPPAPEEYRRLKTRVVDLHPVTLVQNARTSGGGNLAGVPRQAITVGPYETWKAERVSIWHAGNHDNPFGQRLTTFMISKGIQDSSVPMSLLADHPDVQFNFYRHGIGTCEVEMH
jgi:glucosamine-6-phosphate deaminase